METKSKIWLERAIVVGLALYFIFGYLPINTFNQTRGIYHSVGFPFEERIPFVTPFILGYCVVYGSIFSIYLLCPHWEAFKKMAWDFFWITTIHYGIFFLFPVKMIWRPEIVQPHGVFEYLAWFFFSIDHPFNCFPSLHVAYPTLATVLAWQFVPRWKWFFAASAILTAVSVVMIKQHYILDALAGAAISILFGVYAPRKRPVPMC